MVSVQRAIMMLAAFTPVQAWATATKDAGDEGPPVAVFIALIAVVISLGTVFMAARSNKKKD